MMPEDVATEQLRDNTPAAVRDIELKHDGFRAFRARGAAGVLSRTATGVLA